MKDGAAVKCIGGGLVVVTYSVYVGAHVIAGLPPPDGPLFLGTITALGAFLGVRKLTEALEAKKNGKCK
jgi:hypothetical protein